MNTKLAVVRTNDPAGNAVSAREVIKSTYTPEIVIALCGPLGTPLHEVAKLLKNELLGRDYGYEHVDIVRLSDEIRMLAKLPATASTEDLIDAGNDLRRDYGPAVLAQRAIKKITINREQMKSATDASKQESLFNDAHPSPIEPAHVARTCHIIDSIKNSEELEILRSVYGQMLHVIGVYTPIERRIEHLTQKMQDPVEVHRLINRDSGEELKNGQTVQDTFPLSDFFLRADAGTSSQLSARVRRFLDLMLGTKIITPTISERAMYAAYSAARNSACLSRQVGAAITSPEGQIISTGWNDVPRAFGGLYEFSNISSSADDDHRCYNKDGGKCFNDEEKSLLANTVIQKLTDKGLISDENRGSAFEVIRHDSQLRSLIEFSRAVHAEMHALLNAGRADGAKITGGSLYVTTYPCHSCARHIIAAGIKEVFFIEPYRKSLATKLHSDAITENESGDEKVKISPFDGVAPSRFLKFFNGEDRKDSKTGKLKVRAAVPVTAITLEAIHTLEALAVKELHSKGLGA